MPQTDFRSLGFRLACLFVLGCPAVAAELKITEVRLNASDRLQVTASAEAASYYVLRRGSEPGDLQAPVALALGGAATVTLTDPATTLGRTAAFYRLQQVPLAQPLDSDGDGIDDVFELQHPTVLNPLRSADAAEDFDNDGVSNLAEFRAGTPLDADARPTSVAASPFPGEGDVSVNRETVLRFSHALAADTLLRADDLYAEFAGRQLLARAELSSDRRTATLFYLEPLPGSARVRVWFEGDAVRDDTGRLVDADGDGQPGGRLALDFDTVNTTPTPNTAVIGRVFASELLPSPTGLQSVNQPLAGVTVTVDGQEETLRAVTDAAGNFRLEPAPAGRFFVHVDGRTSPRSVWPEGDYYPFVGKAWEAAAGRADNLAGGNGEIFLPLIRAGTLQAVSATAETRVTLPPAVVAANPALAGIELVVPPNSLFSESGVRGGKIGLAPVAPDRLPEPLPPGLNLPLVITVQSDGGQNFDRPVPVRFPNLPDATTGLPLPAGSRSALWSFNHDLGRWEVAGPMQVSADGAYVETLAGVGIRQPGWHGEFPGCPNYKKPNPKAQKKNNDPQPKPKDPPPPPPDPCKETPAARERRALNRSLALQELQTCGADSYQVEQEFNRLRGRLTDHLRTMRRETETLRNSIVGLSKEKARDAIAAAAGRVIAAHNRAEATAGELSNQGPDYCDALGTLASCLGDAYERIQDNCEASQGCQPSGLDAALCKAKRGVGRRVRELSDSIGAACNGGDPTARVLRQYHETASRLEELRRKIEVVSASSPRVSRAESRPQDAAEDALFQELDEIITQLDQGVGGGFTEIDVALSVVEEFRVANREIREIAMAIEAEDFGLTENSLFYAIELPDGIVRGQSSDQGTFEVILPPATAYRIHLFDPQTRSSGWADDRTGAAGVRAVLPSVPWKEEALPDTDGDGLVNEAEFVLGTNASGRDSDSDGLSDGEEIAQGSKPLDGRPAVVGILNSLRLPGEAVHVVTANGLAAVALGESGVALVNILGGLAPSVIGAVDTPGSASAVALGNSVMAVADGAQGLALVDITDPAGARIFRQVKFTGRVEAVAVLGNRVYAGTSDNRVHTLDATGGERLRSLTLTSPVKRLTPGGGLLYAAGANSVSILRPTPAGLVLVGSFFPALAFGMEVQDVFVADGVAWVTYQRGVITFDVSDPANPRPLHTSATEQFGWKQSVLNGAGLLLGAVGRNSSIEAPNDHDLSLYSVTAPDAEPALVVTLPTPGIAYSLAVDNGRAYVADGLNGFLVLNYLAIDTGTTPPTVAVRVLAANSTVESGKFFTAAAAARDDVQVRSVEFYLDGQLAAADSSPPFEQTLPAPQLTATKTSFVVRAKAFDTGGNAAWSEPVTITLAEDITAPELVRVSPADATGSEELRQFVATFSEPINHDSVTAESFRLRDAGPDLAFDTADDVLVTRGGFAFDDANSAVYLQFNSPLAAGRYRLELAATLMDRAGLALPVAATSETFTGYGLRAEYSQLGTFEPLALLLSRLDRNIDFNWDFTGPDPSVGGTFFARWTGQITPRFSEVYEFALPQADGSGLRRLWVDGQLVFDDRFFSAEVARGSIFLEAGRAHDLILELDFAGSGRTRLTWSSPSQPEETVPFTQLRPTSNTRATALLAALSEPTLDRVFLRFDQALDSASAGTVASYVLTPAVPIRTATLLANGRDVELLTAPLPADTRHTIRVSGVRDSAAKAVTGEASFTTPRLVSGAVRREFYVAPGFNDPVTASPGWPLFPVISGTLPSFTEAPQGTGADANRVLGFLQPATTTVRRFVLSASAGSTLLFTSPEGTESTLLSFPAINPPFRQISEPVRVEAGQRYRLDLRGVANSPARFNLGTALAPAYERTLVVETEDYDFGGGQQVAAASGHPYLPGQYANRPGTPEVDFHATESFINLYRPGPPAQPNLAGPSSPAYHGGVLIPDNYLLTVLAEGDWLNYTRVFTAARYRIYLVFESNTYATHFSLDRVTAGVGTASQTLADLGRFEGDGNGGSIFPLTDDAAQAVELDLEGATTLRLTGTGLNDNGPDYLLFVPVADVPADALALLPPSPQYPPLAGPELFAPVPADGAGFLLRETWTGVTAATLAEFRASPAAQQTPNETALVDRFEVTSFQVFEPSVTRLRGWVVPYRSGPHRFFLSASRPAELFLSPDAQPAQLALAATEPVGAQAARSWFKSAPPTRDPAAPENWTSVVNLTASQRYAVEVWVRHSDPNDHVGVTWHPPGALQPANTAEPISGLHLVAPDQP